VPDLARCSLCGKQVLISHYAWSKNQTICQICAELDVQHGFTAIDQNKLYSGETSRNQTKPFPYIGKFKSFIKTRSNGDKEEILVTWPSLLKVAFSMLLLLSLILLGHMNWTNSIRKSSPDLIPSVNID